MNNTQHKGFNGKCEECNLHSPDFFIPNKDIFICNYCFRHRMEKKHDQKRRLNYYIKGYYTKPNKISTPEEDN